ncbi:MarR family winged helix-turn-helix transcriptional regulator [Cohnella hashimotonis]|uniref:MarR family transcriptional regulator n=1 Tax=Cohnella hashimotonis TaxID=2826895 RepID=A0ABT6TMA1_9BACL|nr:MarR family transcriptional regulator [Cohnella hashimotonis]MDI4647864.1 MarR family transcriptional regulator [Cohnella hashimotonis]
MDRRKYLSAYLEKFTLHRKMWETAWAKHNKNGLTSSQAFTLILLNAGPQQPKDLMYMLGVTSGGVTVIADKLSELGAVRRVKHGEDGRAVFLELTEKGREMYPDVKRDFDALMDEVFTPLTDAEVAMLAQLFGKLVDGN